jgi:hypothetical protein
MSAVIISIDCPRCQSVYARWSVEPDLCPRCDGRSGTPSPASSLDDAPSLPPPSRQALFLAVDVSGTMNDERHARVVEALGAAFDRLKQQVEPGTIELCLFAFTSDVKRVWPTGHGVPYGDITACPTEVVRRLPAAWQPGTSLFDLLQKAANAYVAPPLNAARPLTIMIFTDGQMEANDAVRGFLRKIREARPSQPVPGLPAWKQPAARVFGIAPEEGCRSALGELFGDEFVRVVDPADAASLTRLLIAVTQNAIAA